MIKKINKYKKSLDSNKLIETMLDLKLEIEGYTGQHIDLDKQLDEVEREIKAKGGKPKKASLLE